jgi:hypothetical protein
MRLRIVSLREVLVVIFALTFVGVPSLSAQRASSSLPHPNVIFTNPFGPIFEMFTAEYERRLNPSVSFGLSGTYWAGKLDDDFRQNSLNARVRFYPYEMTPRGFSIGVALGVTRIRDTPESCSSPDPCPPRKTTNPSFGVELAHNWYMGPSQRFVLGSGFGIKRLFGETAGDTDILPMFRLNIGYAF